MNIMAEGNNAVMAEVINLLEVEPASSPARLLAATFLLFVSSLLFWFLPANARKQSA